MTDQETARSSFFPRLTGIAAILAVHFFALVILVLVFCSVVPVYMEVFDFWNIELPDVTLLAINISFVCNNYWYLAVLFIFPADAILVVMFSLLGSKRRWVLSVYSHLFLVAVILLLLFVIVSMGVPIRHLAEPALLTQSIV